MTIHAAQPQAAPNSVQTSNVVRAFVDLIIEDAIKKIVGSRFAATSSVAFIGIKHTVAENRNGSIVRCHGHYDTREEAAAAAERLQAAFAARIGLELAFEMSAKLTQGLENGVGEPLANALKAIAGEIAARSRAD